MFPLDKGILTDENGTKLKKPKKNLSPITYVEDTIPLVCAGDDLASNTNFAILYCHGNPRIQLQIPILLQCWCQNF